MDSKIKCSLCESEEVEHINGKVFLCKSHYFQLAMEYAKRMDIGQDMFIDEIIGRNRSHNGVEAIELVQSFHIFCIYKVQDMKSCQYVCCPTCQAEVKCGSGRTTLDRHILSCVCCGESFSQEMIIAKNEGGK